MGIKRVLITSAGRRGYLIKYFKEALGDKGEVYAGDCSPNAPALYKADRGFLLPRVDDECYIEVLLSICKDNQIDLLLSVNDLELPVLANNVEKFEGNGIRVLISSPDVITKCEDKLETAHFLKKNGISSPWTFSDLPEVNSALRSNEIDFPIMIKPRKGSASKGIAKVGSMNELERAWENTKKPIAQEFLQGEEYGFDILNDFSGNVISVIPRKKIAMRAGETDKAVSVKEDKMLKLGEKLGLALGHIGPIDADFFVEPSGEMKVMEINPRFGGGYPLSHSAGADFPSKIIKLLDGEELQPDIGSFQEGVRMFKSYDIVSVTSNNRETLEDNRV